MSKIENPCYAILGGTFDPIHNGHLRVAEEVADALRLDYVTLIPSGTPPHRAPPMFSAQQRLAMCRLAAQDNPRLRVDEREVMKNTSSYTVETLETIRQTQPKLLKSAPQVLPSPVPVLILGADAFLGLPKWHRWLDIFELAHIALVSRPGFDVQSQLPEALNEIFAARYVSNDICGAIRNAHTGIIVPVTVTALDISATKIRALCAADKSVRCLVPDAVRAYLSTIVI